MKDKPNEWVSISDLMAGLLAVVMLLLVLSVLQKKQSELQHQKEMNEIASLKKNRISDTLNELKNLVEKNGADQLVSVDVPSGKVTLRDNVFERGSACISPETRKSVAFFQDKVAEFLNASIKSQVFIEGHTDNLPVSKPVTDYVRFCTVYDDNFTLSAARAREARRLLIGGIDTDTAKRIVVAGYGDSQPINGIQPGDARNRRVEMHFSVLDAATISAK
ncbi:OmpA family protein [Undibacterium amnicola]|uniref:OmpA family protein n=1 Tax=Undibacterium amnicola TaxID=1834038 RepID=A0ABR6XVZ9_9BURK|nr:OmpA family protein [Undibacterium amnicola]MBC3833645.1 OmpA family protein [Undibacterium amnicola]